MSSNIFLFSAPVLISTPFNLQSPRFIISSLVFFYAIVRWMSASRWPLNGYLTWHWSRDCETEFPRVLCICILVQKDNIAAKDAIDRLNEEKWANRYSSQPYFSFRRVVKRSMKLWETANETLAISANLLQTCTSIMFAHHCFEHIS